MNAQDFALQLVRWYRAHKRELPWRNTHDPYLIWLSEIILQQTRVNQGMPYYIAFAEKYPTVGQLADAPPDEVMRLWQGLGYYSRARNMHATARIVQSEHKGIFPNNYQDLLTLKGIGPYTAAAIASFAYDEAVAVVDGNVYRVLARIFGIDDDIASTSGQKVFTVLAQELIAELPASVRPSEYNQAIMEFGAIHCKPALPLCETCIFSTGCQAYLSGQQAQLPVKKKKTKIKERSFHYYLIEYQGRFLMRKRPPGDIWQGLYELPLVEEGVAASSALLAHLHTTTAGRALLHMAGQPLPVDGMDASLVHVSEAYRHQLTHQRLSLQFVHIKVHTEELWMQFSQMEHCQSYAAEEVHKLGMPILIARYLHDYFF